MMMPFARNKSVELYNHLIESGVDRLPSTQPAIVRKYFNKSPIKALQYHDDLGVFHPTAFLLGICGYRDSLRYFNEAFLVRLTVSGETRQKEISAGCATLQWASEVTGLTGYAELFNRQPPTNELTRPDWLHRQIRYFATNATQEDQQQYGTPAKPGIMWKQLAVHGLQNYLLEMGYFAELRLHPNSSSVGLERNACDREMAALSDVIRKYLGIKDDLVTEQKPDPIVVMPPNYPSDPDEYLPGTWAGGYLPPVATVFVRRGTDDATIERLGAQSLSGATPSDQPLTGNRHPRVCTGLSDRDRSFPLDPDTTPSHAGIPTDGDITPSWEAVEIHLGEQAKEILNPPATYEQIRNVETTLGLVLPPQLRASLARHNGMNDYPTDEFPGGKLLSCQDMLTSHQNWQSVFHDLLQDQQDARIAAEYNVTGTTGLTLPGLWNPGWVPITDDGTGNALAIDTTPGPTGSVGQIIRIVTDGSPEGVVYHNLATLLNEYLQEDEV